MKSYYRMGRKHSMEKVTLQTGKLFWNSSAWIHKVFLENVYKSDIIWEYLLFLRIFSKKETSEKFTEYRCAALLEMLS